MAEVKAQSFDAEVDKILQLMIHSLYEHKEIFLRELISNASDACDRLRYQAVTKPELAADDPEFKITITPDEKAGTLTISDNGVGMSATDMQKNLGTIARSGTQNFAQNLSGDKQKDVELIGQFGVGFYSAFMVADKVEVISKPAGGKSANKWVSQGNGTYTIEKSEKASRGTEITLYLRDEEKEYLDPHRIRHIISTYSNHIAFAIELKGEEGEAERLNKGNAIWARSKSDLSDEEYNEFYQSISYLGADTPWLTMHNKVEGVLEYTNLLFVPSAKPFDLFHPDRSHRVKLYVKRVFIADNDIPIIPQYLRFLRGVVDSEDLPLNISRETVQNNVTVQKIRRSVTKKVLSELAKKAESDAEGFKKFWENFGAVIKEGLCDQTEPKEDILKVCRFHSLLKNDLISLEDYIANAKEGQKAIYYLAGDSLEQLKSHPQIEGFKAKGVDVLLLDESVDDFWVNVVPEYNDFDLMSVTRSNVDLDTFEELDDKKPETEDKKDEGAEKLAEGFIAAVREVLSEHVSEVRTTNKLTDSPVCLAVGLSGMDMRMERFLVENNQLPGRSKKIFEVNPDHKIIKSLSEQFKASGKSEEWTDTIHLLFAEASIIEGEPITDISGFAKRFNQLIASKLAA